MNIIEFKLKDTLGDAGAIAALKDDIVIGHIRTNPLNGHFQFFNGPLNQLNYSMQDADLERLKRQIEQRYAQKQIS